MKIEVNKNELERELIALGKLISRMSPVPEHKSLLIECKDGKVCFSTRSPSEQMTFRTAYAGEVEFRCIVGFDEFRDAVRGYRNKVLEIEDNEGTLRVGERTLFPMSGVEWRVPDEGEHCSVSELPKDFVALFAAASPLVDRNNPRKVLQGINLCREGITTTNGKELLNIYVPLNVDDFTIPLPLALMQTKTAEAGMLCTWTDRTGKMCRIETEHWVWYAEGLEGNYPNWKQVIPADNALDYSITFHEPKQVIDFLKTVPDHEPYHGIELNVTPEGVSVIPLDYPDMHLEAIADHAGVRPRAVLVLNKHILLRMLAQGYCTFRANSDGLIPVVAEGGYGRYLAMPIRSIPGKYEKSIQPKQEQKKMETTENKVVESNDPVPAASPLEELSSNVEELRSKLKHLLDESGILIRKVKEVTLLQKQKEREFVQTRRRLERIKMAM